MRLGIMISVFIAICSSFAQNCDAQESNYWDPRPVPIERQESPTSTRAARIITAAPIMPNVNTSGFCCLVMDIAKDGLPENISAEFCSSRRFAKSAIGSAKKWGFKPAVIENTPIRVENQRHIVTFKLTAENGRVIPDKKRLIVHNGKIDFSIDRLCKTTPIT